MTIDPTIRKVVLETISSNEEELIKFLKDLVRIPSVVGEEGEAQKFIGTKFTEMTLQVDTWEPDFTELRDHPAFFETTSYTKHGYKGRPNVTGRLKGTGKGPPSDGFRGSGCNMEDVMQLQPMHYLWFSSDPIRFK